jgi:transcriptional regulator with XRE-family HTH domain
MLPHNIRFLRNKQGLSQVKWGNIFGLTRAMVDSYERGIASPDTNTLAKIAKHYDISIENLLTMDIEKNTTINFHNTSSYPSDALLAAKDELIIELREQIKLLKEQLSKK